MAKFDLKELLRVAKQNAKNGPTKNKIWALICGIAIVALFIWWIFILASF